MLGHGYVGPVVCGADGMCGHWHTRSVVCDMLSI